VEPCGRSRGREGITVLDDEYSDDEDAQTGTSYVIGYRRPPLHTRFQPGVSGNPSGRAKGSKNLKTLFHEILNEEISLREGGEVKKITKAEAVLRGLVIGAIKSDPRNIVLLFKDRGSVWRTERACSGHPED
jgi:hypothetical protein